MSKLTAKEESFVKQYPVDLCGASAARKAGYSTKNARHIALQLMQKPHIRDAIRAEMQKRCKKYEAEADRVVKELADIAFLDRSQIYQIRDGHLKVTDTDLLPERARKIISKVSETAYGLRIEFDDRIRALELLGRHLALFTDNIAVSGTLSTIDAMSEEEIDAELAKLASKEATAGKAAGSSEA